MVEGDIEEKNSNESYTKKEEEKAQVTSGAQAQNFTTQNQTNPGELI